MVYYSKMTVFGAIEMKTTYKTRGVCARKIDVDIEDGVIKDVQFTGGCDGNLQGVTKLVKNMNARDVIENFRGIKCSGKPTSCPDQLAKALEAALEQQKTEKQ